MLEDDLIEKEKSVVRDEEPIKILFVGDIMLDRHNRVIADEKGVDNFTKLIRPIFKGNDLVVANLEGSVTDEESVSVGTLKGEEGHLRFTFDKTHTRDFLNYNNIDMVSLGNNHILNFGDDGLNETKRFLAESKIEYFGDPNDIKNAYIAKNIKGKNISFVSFSKYKYSPTSAKVIQIIEMLNKKSDLVIVYAHWGEGV